MGHTEKWNEINDELIASGIFPKKKLKQIEITRSALIEYKEKFGVEYIIGPNTFIIEDVNVRTSPSPVLFTTISQ